MKSTPLLHVAFQPSRIAATLIGAATIASATLLALLPGDAWLRGAAVVATGGGGMRALRRASTTGKDGSIESIELGADRRAIIIDRSGHRTEGVIQPESYVGALLTMLVLRPNGAHGSLALAIWPDTMPADEFRRLRVVLRHGEPPRDET
jgi:hypothetical protein